MPSADWASRASLEYLPLEWLQMTRIRAVLFDYGLVLSGPPDPVAQQRLETLLHRDSTAFHSAYWMHLYL